MRLKQMNIHGFKSFAQPVNIEFHKGITCIVGPNGSGKSNISDALRWVLGEQSPRTLRGDKMDEIIFAGTDKSKSRGMAEVTLVIDNTCGTFSVDFAEVAITRRLYRSGESEYLINGAPCRLRDIRTMIMDTGIGVDGYSVIGQGKIADIVSSKAEDRREIFEEAAGIVKYRSKKEEAERKLLISSQNLDRINDIINEVDDRRKRLETESAKAERYLELKSEYKKAEINVILNSIETIDLANEYVKDEIIEAQSSINIHSTRKTETEQKLTDEKAKSRELEAKDIETRDKYMNLSSELGSLKNRRGIITEKLSSINTRIQAYDNDIESLQLKLNKEKNNLNALITDDSGIEDKLTELEIQIKDREAEYESRLKELETEFDYESEKSKYERLTIEEKKLAESSEMMKSEIAHNKSKIEILDGLESSYEGYNYAVKFLMQQNAIGIEGVAADLITVPDGYETAVGAALGAQLQNVVCTDDNAARSAINLLKENKAGRLTFLPVKTIRPFRDNNDESMRRALTLPGVIGRASDCVRTDIKYKNIADYLLGRVIIADKLESAVRVSKQLLGGYRFVTLEGELINNAGAITGGSLKSGKSGILERKAQISKTEKYLDRLNERYSQRVAEWDKIRRELLQTKNRLDEYEHNYAEKKRNIISERDTELLELKFRSGNITAEKNNLVRMAEHLKANVKDIESDIAFKQTNKERLDSETRRFHDEADDLDTEIQEKEKLLKETEYEINAVKDMRNSVSEITAKLEEEKNDADKKVYHFQTMKYELEMKEEKNTSQMDALKNKLWDEFEVSYAQALELQDDEISVQEEQRKAKKTRSMIKELGDVNISAISEYKEVSERYDFLSGQRSDLDASIESLSGIIRDLDNEIKKSFTETFNSINDNFTAVFKDLFGGGSASLSLQDSHKPLESGIDIIAQPPGKKLQNINLMSGGEKTMTAIALMLAVLKTKPTPFCILDEVEAALDDANVDKFSKYLSGFSEIQFILITHQKVTMQYANVLYGITMPERGVSKVFSLKLSDKTMTVPDAQKELMENLNAG